MTQTQGDDRIAQAWRAHHSYLVDLAFRMLRDIGEAEDVVQEAFARLLRTGFDQIEDARGWLIVVTSRLCLDTIRSAKSRRQRGEAEFRDDVRPPLLGSASVDPADRVTLDDSVRLALLVVLEHLSPAERVVFVLHDVFQLPFGTIAETIGRSVQACRQLARRARQKVERADSGSTSSVPESRHRLVTDRFIAACANGDVAGLLEVLDPEVSGVVDIRAQYVVRGADRVAPNLLRYWGPGTTLVSQPAGEDLVLLGFIDRRLAGVLMLSMKDNRIWKIHAIADPVKLDFLRSELSSLS